MLGEDKVIQALIGVTVEISLYNTHNPQKRRTLAPCIATMLPFPHSITTTGERRAANRMATGEGMWLTRSMDCTAFLITSGSRVHNPVGLSLARLKKSRNGFANATLFLTLVFLIPSGTALEKLQQTGQMFALQHSWVWMHILMPHQVWAILILRLVLLREMRSRAKSPLRADEPFGGTSNAASGVNPNRIAFLI
jgi:hypothetical protein